MEYKIKLSRAGPQDAYLIFSDHNYGLEVTLKRGDQPEDSQRLGYIDPKDIKRIGRSL